MCSEWGQHDIDIAVAVNVLMSGLSLQPRLKEPGYVINFSKFIRG